LITQVLLNATIRTTQDKLANEVYITTQFFNPVINKWDNLLEKVLVKNGAFKGVFNEKLKTKKALLLLAMLSDGYDIGLFPQLRLINSNPQKAEMPEVIAYGGTTSYSKTLDTVTINFDDVWLYDVNQLKEQLNYIDKAADHIIAATTRPNEKTMLCAAMFGALSGKTANEIQTLQKENETLITNTEVIKKENETLLANTEAIKKENAALILHAEAMKKEYEKTIAELTAAAGTTTATTMEANKVYTGVVNEMAKAADLMKNSKYEISKLSLDLKVLVKNDAAGNIQLQMVDGAVAEKIAGDTLSNLRIDISTRDISTVNTAVNSMNSVIGLTETEARKKLIGLGLKMKSVYQLTDEYTIGQAFKQTPEANTDILEGSLVTVIFAKDKNEFH
jgi:PASTA domain